MSSILRNPSVAAACKELTHLGATFVVATTRKTVKLQFQYKGRSGTVVCAQTPSDRRVALKSRATVRHMLGAIDRETAT